jgi:hypothetical protein
LGNKKISQMTMAQATIRMIRVFNMCETLSGNS